VAGSPTTAGVAAFRDNVAAADATVVARPRSAGAIPVARTKLPDFALRFHTDNALHGATVNPWNPRLSPGGSSGGEAVALATGMPPLGLGNDLADSIRMPALSAGVCGLKPSRGRVPWWNATDLVGPPLVMQLMAVNGPMARSVADLRAALAVISGSDPRDPWSVPFPAEVAAHTETGPRAVAVIAEPEGVRLTRMWLPASAALPTRWRKPDTRSKKSIHGRSPRRSRPGRSSSGPNSTCYGR
jgi:amidase